MKERSYIVRFLTPAFLGNAEQNGQWRTPPFKALLRQWWRVAVAKELNFNVNAIRSREGDLFGVAADGSGSHKSLVRIRLNRWDEGKLKNWESTDRVNHPEVKNKEAKVVPVGSDLYLGYGPLMFAQQKTSLKQNAAIQYGEEATFSIACPEAYVGELTTALWMMARYGALGGRSRNGWGSFSLEPANQQTPALTGLLPTCDWRQALGSDWPHAIGSDGHPLIWKTNMQGDWKIVMAELAKIKIGLRTQFDFNTGKNASAPEKRHWLSYPVTNHSVRDWGNNARLPNSLRFKVRQDEGGRLHGVIFHVPCKPPDSFRPDADALKIVWRQVHQYLDNLETVSRIAE